MLVHYLLVTFINSTGADYNLEVDLCHSIVPALSKTRVMTTKIEIRMKKKMGVQWKALEGVGTDGTEGMCRVSSQSHSLFANYFIGVSKTDVWWKPPQDVTLASHDPSHAPIVYLSQGPSVAMAKADVEAAATKKPVDAAKHQKWEKMAKQAEVDEAEEKKEGDVSKRNLKLIGRAWVHGMRCTDGEQAHHQGPLGTACSGCNNADVLVHSLLMMSHIHHQAALNSLFQTIYKDADPETQRVSIKMHTRPPAGS